MRLSAVTLLLERLGVDVKTLSREEFITYMLWLHIGSIAYEWDTSIPIS